MYGLKSFMPAITGKVPLTCIILMEKFSKHSHGIRVKKEGLSKEFDKDGNIITLLEYRNDFLVSRERIKQDG